MQEKIDWYQEVVDLEPGSKLFFPLAKMLASNGETSRALSTLYRGLERNPEYIEARLFLVELLHSSSSEQDHGDELEKQLAIVAPLLVRYTGFWQAWAENAEEYGMQGDSNLVLSFLAASFQHKNISLADIFSAGLKNIHVQDAIQTKSSVPSLTATKQNESKPTVSLVEKTAPHIPTALSTPLVEKPGEEGEEGEEHYSLRTRSMAEVLAEQGDYEGALSIYNELVLAAQSDEEKIDLQSRITTLTANVETSRQSAPAPEEEIPSPAKDRVLSVLESLAERLENRATS